VPSPWTESAFSFVVAAMWQVDESGAGRAQASTAVEAESLDQLGVYTLNTLPQDKSGIYEIRDSDGAVYQLAVDIDGPVFATSPYKARFKKCFFSL